ncbi:beta-carotene 15,15'-monooxygenase [Enterococcus saccharolyticus]|uniref:permease prefix domain 1-containing protein n=1 Tax=Enterococcus saccharolyticus TaxID=41997 RepID=UPI001E2E5FFD|nr:permease prefix domain 1-containing protein [Enterococcus saccharolyticus]MCD5003239.1 beta-carotene 15,15'-monooxygenase [Enterococcus saccharolyticus]
MKIIKDYLDSLFLTVPVTAETQRAKEDLLAIMEDHYYELIEEGKSEHEAIGAVISEFGSIDEILAALELEREEIDEEEYLSAEQVTLDDAFDFWAATRKFALELSLGILLMFFSMASIFMVESYGVIYAMGILGFFVFAALGIGFIISGSMKYVREKRKLKDRSLVKEIYREAFFQLEDYDKSFRVGLVLGIGFCILAIPLTIIFSNMFYVGLMAGSLFFSTIGIGVFLIIYSSIIRHGFKKLTNGQYFVSNNHRPTRASYGNATPLIITLRKFYWPLVALFYFFWSTVTNAWEYSWIIFVIAGMVDSFIRESLKRSK